MTAHQMTSCGTSHAWVYSAAAAPWLTSSTKLPWLLKLVWILCRTITQCVTETVRTCNILIPLRAALSSTGKGLLTGSNSTYSLRSHGGTDRNSLIETNGGKSKRNTWCKAPDRHSQAPTSRSLFEWLSEWMMESQRHSCDRSSGRRSRGTEWLASSLWCFYLSCFWWLVIHLQNPLHADRRDDPKHSSVTSEQDSTNCQVEQ